MPKAKPKIHFAALIGILPDQDLFSWWIPHYAALKLDSYTVFLHASPDVDLNLGSYQLFNDHGFRVVLLPEDVVRENPVRPNDPGPVRSALMDALALTLPKGDFIVTADGDEIQDWPEHPRAYLERGIRLVIGEHIDCFDETLHAPVLEKTLDENYPIRHPNLSALLRSDEEQLNPRKICLSPCRYPVDFNGSHEVKKELIPNAPYGLASGPIPVLHYRWRASLFERIRNRPNWPKAQLDVIKTFFDMKD